MKSVDLRLLVKLGPGAFEAISGEVVKAILLVFDKPQENHITEDDLIANYSGKHSFMGFDISSINGVANKSFSIKTKDVLQFSQKQQYENPDSRIAFDDTNNEKLLNELSHSHHGLVCGDRPQMCVYFWEIIRTSNIWIPYCGTVNRNIFCSFITSFKPGSHNISVREFHDR